MDFNKYSFLYEEKRFMFPFIHSGISKRKKEKKKNIPKTTISTEVFIIPLAESI